MAETVLALFEEAAARAPESGCLCAPPMAGRPYHPGGVEIDYRIAPATGRVTASRCCWRTGPFFTCTGGR